MQNLTGPTLPCYFWATSFLLSSGLGPAARFPIRYLRYRLVALVQLQHKNGT